MREHLKPKGWPKHFWRQNHNLTVCNPIDQTPAPGTVQTDAEDLEALVAEMDAAAAAVREYLSLLRQRVAIDLFDPSRDEVLFGLFARSSRLFLALVEDPQLWARDLGAIVLRCLADTAITFVYLARQGTAEDFNNFIQYGEGQQKLLMLHLQDTYPEGRSAEGRGVNEIERELTMLPEFIDIELGHWAGKDARKLAQEAGMERLHRLVFTPASGDVHGSWHALKGTSLTYCQEPLHRYHRLPHLAEPPFFVGVVETARQLWEECRSVGVSALSYPDAAPTSSFDAAD